MKFRLVSLLFCLVIQGLALSGCSALDKALKPEVTPEVRLEKILLERALEYERRGEFQKALQAYEAAVTVVVAKKDGLEASLRNDAEMHYRRGLELQKEGKYSKARHEFLVALRLWPDSPEVVNQLKPAQPTRLTRYVVHEVKEGEFLTAIAVIARYNNLEDAAKLYAGMQLRIPEIEGVRFVSPKEKPTAEAKDKVTRQAAGEQPVRGGLAPIYPLVTDEPSIASEEEMEYDQAATYQEQGVSLLEEGQYLAALHEFRKVLNTDPSRTRVHQYMAWAHYRQGEVLFLQAEYLAARRHFQEALNLDERCTSCKEYLQRSLDAYKEAHYHKGIQHFEEQRLKEAIEEWQLVSELDSDYKQVQDYLARAQKLLEKVQELKEVP
jgi:tetratricopeptide (TPR) repeat protein